MVAHHLSGVQVRKTSVSAVEVREDITEEIWRSEIAGAYLSRGSNAVQQA